MDDPNLLIQVARAAGLPHYPPVNPAKVCVQRTSTGITLLGDEPFFVTRWAAESESPGNQYYLNLRRLTHVDRDRFDCESVEAIPDHPPQLLKLCPFVAKSVANGSLG